MKKHTNIFSLLFFFFGIIFYAQELPPINQYLPKDYNAENQNWSITQAKNNYIYVANNLGLLEFDGAKWTVYATPNETIMRSVLAVNNKIYSGFYMDFGYWEKNNQGLLEYTSIAKKNKIPLIEDEQFWNIIQLDQWLLFQSLQRIYLFNSETKEFKFIDTDTSIVKMIALDGTIYFQQTSKGIYKLENGKSKLVSDNQVFKNNRIVNVFNIENEIVFLTEEKGFYSLKNNGVKPWNLFANKSLNNKTLYSGIKLKNQDFLLGSISNGLFYLNKNGEIEYQITQQNGLSNNTVLSIFEDKNKMIWLGLDSGINTVNTASKYKIFTDKKGMLGTVYTSILFQNNLYLGTNQGLFYKKYNTNTNFKFIKNTQGQVWSLVEIDNQLFCGHNSGTYLIENNNATKISDVQGTWDIKKLSKNSLLQGNYNGLNILTKENNSWKFRNRIAGFDNSSRYFELLDNNKIIVNHEYKGVFKISVDDAFSKVLEVVKDTSVKKGIHSGLIKYQNKILYASKNGIYKYNNINKNFTQDSIYSLLFSSENYATGKLRVDKNNKLWSFTKNGLNYSVPGKLSSKPIFKYNSISDKLRKGANGYENISYLEKDTYLIGISNGYILLDNTKEESINNFNVSITSIKSHLQKRKEKFLPTDKFLEFDCEENNFEIFFATPIYNKFEEVQYQYKLQGQNNVWSNWSSKSNVLFENLPQGNYTFKVRSRVANSISNNEASFEFKIKKPWYLSNLMLFLYFLTFSILYFIIHNFYKRYYKKQQQEIIKSKQQEIELSSLESEKQLMHLKNEKLLADIESKNRELATSTMSIIKKNEFLNTIKAELNKGEDSSVKNVLKIIDKNLNNTDDWKLFEEAFNNADKDFLKKLKSKHKELTPNDLRLCAYLRLNLSSKEIAPLLNISPRSVEVKRYRLRKKMNLSHNTNLTNYILEI